MPTSRPVRHARPPERRLPFKAPVRAWTLAEWALFPLRLFLGATFAFAGLQKLANPNFLRSASPISIQAQLIGATHSSPLRFLLTHLVQFAKPLGIIIAFSEIAIGVGALLGLWTRVAAIGGAVLSLSLFFVVSFHAAPYYTGADIVFFFAWLPLIVAGSGSRLSLDGWIANRAAKTQKAPPPEIVSIPFAKVQAICGHYHQRRCSAREGLACDAAVCPVLLGDRAPLTTRIAIDTLDRRTLVMGGTAAAVVGTTALLLGGATAEVGKLIGGAKTPVSPGQLGPGTGTSTTTAVAGGPTTTVKAGSHPSGTVLGPASQVPVGNAATFTIPSSGDPGIVIQPTAGQFVAYDAVCPHAGCTVGYYAANKMLVCPCHASEFQVGTGDVLQGPAPHGLTKLNVVQGSDGNLYLK